MSGIPLQWWTSGTVTGAAGSLALEPPPGPVRIQTIDAQRGLGDEAHTRFLHVCEQGAVLRKSGGRIRITRKQEELLHLPVVKLQGVVLYGKVQVTTQCLRFLMEEGVWLSMFTRQGVYKGRIQPPAERGGHLRRLQWERSADRAFGLGFGKAVVRGKLLAAKAVAAAQAKNRLAESLGEGHRILRECLEQVESADSLERLRGIEGTGSRAYFDLFRRWNLSEFPFEGRDKRGAADPVNILLNFGYSLLARELDGLIESAGLDPAAGFYHQPHYDRPSLACDLMEEFRHVVVDRLVIRLINQRTIKVEDFEDADDRGLRFSRDGLKKYVGAYEKLVVGTGEEDRPGWRPVFLKQLGRLLDAIHGGPGYRSHLEEAVAAPESLAESVSRE